MSSFIWTPSWTEKFIKLRLQNDHLFQKKFRSWSSFRKILIKEGFPKDIETRVYNKKWSNIYQDYQNVIIKKSKTWKYQELFEKYMQKSPAISRKWSTVWIKKLLEIRIEHEDTFKSNPENINQYEESWSLIERKIKDAGLPVEYSVQKIDHTWDLLLKKFKLKYFKNQSKDETENSGPYYELLKKYFEKYQPNCELFDSDDDMEPLSKLKNDKVKQEPDYSVLNSVTQEFTEDFKWTPEWTESFIHLKFQNEHLFKKKYNVWKKFHKLMISNGFPEILTVSDVRKKWSYIIEGYKNAVLLDNKSWIHYGLIQTYMDNNTFDVFKNWPEEWVKCLIKTRIKNNSFFIGSFVDQDRKWMILEVELRKAGIPNQCILRNIRLIWSSLVKKFKFLYNKRKVISPESVWPYYQHMNEYFTKCNPKYFTHESDSKCKNDESDVSFDYPNMEEKDPIEPEIAFDFLKIEKDDQSDQKICLNVKKEFLGYSCRCCLQSTEQVVSLYESFDNIPLLQKFTECTNISIEENTNYPYHLCHPCLNQLNIAYEFRKKCEQSNIVLKNSSAIDKTKVENMEIEPNDDLSEFNFDDDVLKTHYSSSDVEEKIQRPKVKKKILKKTTNPVKKKKKNAMSVEERIHRKKFGYTKMCEICGKSGVHNMKEHMRSHSDEKTINCELCPKTFKYRSVYTNHLKTHSETPLQVCQLCGKEFYRNTTYKKHLVYHANERKYSCETCGKTFNTKDILRVHIRSHTGERPYSCKICGKTFLSSGCVGRHQKVHK